MRIGDVRNREGCGFRLGAEDWVAMMIRSLRGTNVHIISRVGGSSTERRLREFLRSSGFMEQTGFIADNVHFRSACSGTRGKGVVFRNLSGRSRGLPYGHPQPDARVGDALSDSNHVCQRLCQPLLWDAAARKLRQSRTWAR